jgi:hypothetical protein
MFKPLPTTLGIDLSLWTIITVFFSLMGLLLGLLIFWERGRYCQYTTMKKPFLVPYGSDDNEKWYKIFVIDDHGKLIWDNIKWEENKPFYAKLCFRSNIKNNRTYLTFEDDDQYYYISKYYIEDIYNELKDNILEGYFISEKVYNRYQTLYPIKYLGKKKPE